MFSANHIPYSQANSFTRTLIDYVEGQDALRPFFNEPPTIEGIRNTIVQKQKQVIDRKTLVSVLEEQYRQAAQTDATRNNINLLLAENTFTVCTAHQPNLFTGPLYFIYKILHAIRLAQQFKADLPEFNFVPVYYMGSEDADLDELNHTYVEGKKLAWKTDQTGAVGRMKVDKKVLELIRELEGQLGNYEHGREVLDLLLAAYQPGKTMQQSTFELVNALFGKYGLVVLIPDHSALKAQMLQVFEEDLFQHTPSAIVRSTSEALAAHYPAQAYPRPVNLFYLKDNIRERIERNGNTFDVVNTPIRFTEEEMKEELKNFPERFSPNVVLRGLFQETILPDIVFVGGGGELAYWLQLKDLFVHFQVVYPVLVVRNSFLIIERKWQERIKHLGLDDHSLFRSEKEIIDNIARDNAKAPVNLNGSFEKADALYEHIIGQAGAVDPTLLKHASAIKTRSLKILQELEKKMLRAEKRKYTDQQRQLQAIRNTLFPRNGLQERVENFSSFYAKYGSVFIDALLEHSKGLEQQFCILRA